MINMMMKCLIWSCFLVMHAVIIVLYIVLTVCFRWPVMLLNWVALQVEWAFYAYDAWSSKFEATWQNTRRKYENEED